MKLYASIRDRIRRITDAFERYPLTVAFLLIAVILMAIQINTDREYSNALWTLSFGAVLCAAIQSAYERYFTKTATKLLLYGIGIALTAGYYLLVQKSAEPGRETEIRTLIAIFALVMATIWLPVIKSSVSFNESFMASFKAFFLALLFSAVLFAGCSLIFAATNTLITHVDSKAYSHAANIIFVLFAPVLFLSLIPVYPGEGILPDNQLSANKVDLEKASRSPRFLEVLISYVIIPLAAVFTVILVAYIAINIKGQFWTNNLLEPMLVSYAVSIILLYVLSSRMENKVAMLFRKVFPKILIPIVLFQIAASVLNLRDTGLTHARYLVILFGLFAAVSGVVLSIVPVRKNGIIAALLIVFSLFSITPPVDAFTLSRMSQTGILTETLTKNNMLSDNRITPKATIATGDKQKIVSSVQYLQAMGYTGSIGYLPAGFDSFRDFNAVFGFNDFDLPGSPSGYISVILGQSEPIDVQGYDDMARTYIGRFNDQFNDGEEATICTFDFDGNQYVLQKDKTAGKYDIILADQGGQELIRFKTDDIRERYSAYTTEKTGMSAAQAAFTQQNDLVKLTVVVNNANIDLNMKQNYSADLYLFVQFK